MKLSCELRADARNALRGHLTLLICADITVGVATSCLKSIPLIAIFTSFLICIPLGYGLSMLVLDLVRHQPVKFIRIFGAFNSSYWKYIWTTSFCGMYIFFWYWLLFVPGVIKSFSYAMTPFIIIDHPEYGCNQAITMSRKMMDGNKWRLACLYFSFIGWWLLSVLTCGIALFWIIPYFQTSVAAFYEELKNREENTINAI